MPDVDLTGVWRAALADEELRRRYPDPGFDDRGWAEIAVPGHWRSTDAFAGSDGPILHRKAFEAASPTEGRRAWLELDGLFYQGDIWLDGSYVGDTEGYFAPAAFEVTDALRDRTEHTLAIEVTCAPQRDLDAKRNITGVFQHWDCIDPGWNPGGIWRPVRVTETGPARIMSMRVLCPAADATRARVRIRANIDTAVGGPAELRTRIGDQRDHVETKVLAAGENRVQWEIDVPDPDLWWPHSLGGQPLVDVSVDVVLADGEVSDTRSVTTGLRHVSMKRWILSVNGERLHLKGSNLGPARMGLADASADELAADVALARDAGLDLLRVHGHVTRPEVYEEADRVGMLLWQDFPLQWSYARGVRKQAAAQARAMVDLLGHHPSIALWCGHNEPVAHGENETGGPEAPAVTAKTVALHGLPGWNKSVLDTSVKRALERADGTRPVIPHSGVLPHPGSTGTDSHLYFGWYWGDERDLDRALAVWPNLGRFVSEFGAQAVPYSDSFMEPSRWPDLNWDQLEKTHGLQRGALTRLGLDPTEFATFDQWRDATQRYQAELIRRHVESLRRIKYRPNGGFCQFLLADCHPAVSWSVLDHERRPKAGWAALAEACAPVIVVADRPQPVYLPGEPITLDVHAVSDLRQPIGGAQVTATLAWTGGAAEWAWEGDVAADDCVRIATIEMVAPDSPGPLVLDLELVGGDVKATNRYTSVVAPTS